MQSTSPPSKNDFSDRIDVLLVDDDPLVLRAVERMLKAGGFTVHKVSDSEDAVREALRDLYDVIISDIHMPRLTGCELIDALRGQKNETPVLLMTGAPTIQSAQDAVELGAAQYLTKPVDRDSLVRAVARARAKSREARALRKIQNPHNPEQAEGFERALANLWMAFQPIVSLATNGPIAYEALVRSKEPTFCNPGLLLDYAEKHGRLADLGRKIRRLCADAMAHLPAGTDLFINLHSADLFDAELFSPTSPLAEFAGRIVLELTERGAIEGVKGIAERIERLRGLGYRVAIDDLGAGYAGLTSVALLNPDFVKLDMSLTREIASSPIKRRLVASMIDACRDCGFRLVAEGVETERELAILRELGCDLLQGYYFARPGPEFVIEVATLAA